MRSHPTFGAESEDKFESRYELSRAFNQLCQRKRCTISPTELAEMRARQEGIDSKDASLQMVRLRYAAAVRALNRELDIPSSSSPQDPATEVTIDTFVAVMQRKELRRPELAEIVTEGVSEIRDVLLKEDAMRKVALATNMSYHDMYKPPEVAASVRRRERFLRYLDPIIGVVILLNALVIGVSTDVAKDAEFWQWCEFSFTLVFVVELAMKIITHGPRKFFFGSDWTWNWFDTVVVLIAILDLVLTLVGNVVDLGNLTVVRLLRFARLTKLVRVLKLKAFKELALLCHGIIAGFRTLLWAIVFLAFLLLAIGVLMTQIVGGSTDADWAVICDGKEPGDAARACSDSAEHLKLHRQELFGNVPRSMFTVFRCFTDGCSSVDGTPLMPNLYNTHGLLVIGFYMMVTLFVIFGLFNLIMAVFVENTIENAKHDDVRRREARSDEHLRVARRLQEVIVLFCTGQGTDDEEATQCGSEGSRWFRKMFATTRSNTSPLSRSASTCLKGKANLSFKVTHSTFVKMIQRQEVQDMLDDLDIGVSSRQALFDVLDANGNGTLEVSELVQGLLKLRGPADKGDVVASLLGVRSMQKSIKAMEALSLHQQEVIEEIAASVTDLRRRRLSLCPPTPAAEDRKDERYKTL
eukprot:CAMPEP_0204548782 /NCGR_PEP_ID=MMETSP0661-20131031/23840_1 /ASSEMBLY_ACC=CAM_ASM_000606 /TAXON_ID=109239 /ORGANISM="Alexandrium margalefi, Strain AMGDE01CS-322" /LENGTH=637 /DNA_ID=CAMNT_0051555707 /DNA_START=55 /DNA_END=1968 /DNA_ORIENTATION=-